MIALGITVADDDDHDPGDDDVVTHSWGELSSPPPLNGATDSLRPPAIFTTGSLGSLKKKEYLQEEFPPKNIC